MMKHIPGPWELSPSGGQIWKDTKGDGTFVICNMSPSNYIMHKTRIANALRIVECVNAMEGIANPKELRYFWDRERCVRQVKNSSIENHLFLSKEELQKLGEQYKNEEETPYIETSQPKDGPTKKDMEELLSYASKYEQLKEVIQNMIDRIDEGGEMTLTKDSIIVHCLREAIK